jgi:AAA domain
VTAAVPLDFGTPVPFSDETYPAYLDEGDDSQAPKGTRPDSAPGPKSATADMLFGPAIAEKLPPLEYLVGEIGLTAGSGAPHLVAGYGFSGKTVALQSMLLALAAGRSVWGGYSGRQSRVVHVDLEQGRRLDCRR